MTPEHRAAKQCIQAAVKRWRCLVPPGFNIRHVYLECDAGDDDSTTIAETLAQWEYHQGKVKWFLPAAAGSTKAYLEATVVHELCHILLAPMEMHLRSGKMNATCEHTVEGVARAFLRTRKASR